MMEEETHYDYDGVGCGLFLLNDCGIWSDASPLRQQASALQRWQGEAGTSPASRRHVEEGWVVE